MAQEKPGLSAAFKTIKMFYKRRFRPVLMLISQVINIMDV